MIAALVMLAGVGAAAEPGPVAPAEPGFELQEGIVFREVEGRQLRLDLFVPRGAPRPLPVVLAIHGGGFTGGERRWTARYGRLLAPLGIAVASVEYRLAPAATHPAQLEDVRGALAWVRTEAAARGFDPERVGAMGESVGGTLSLMLAVDAAPRGGRIRAAVSLAGPTIFEGAEAAGFRWLEAWIPPGPERALRLRGASPASWATPEAAPVLCIHGGDDGDVVPRHSLAMVERLQAVGAQGSVACFPGLGHQLKADPRVVDAMSAFLVRELRPGR